MPMNVIQDKSILPKLPSMPSNPLARGKKPPPPPPPATANNALPSPPRGRENTRPSIGHHKSSASISSASVSSRFSRNEDTSPVSPIPSARPSIGRIRASNQSMERDESPPPPLPGPRPSNGVSKDDRPRIGSYGSSYGGSGGSAVTPTPLAGLRPSALKGSNSSNDVSSVQSTLAGITNSSAGRISNTLTAPAQPSAGRSPSPNSLASIAVGKKKPPPPPPKKKFSGNNNEVWVKAIFAFEGQDHGDLSFNEGDKIRVIKKTDHVDGNLISFVTRKLLTGLDWWTGEVNGRKGQFPANYCEPTT